MSQIAVNGLDAVSGHIVEMELGPWFAEVSVDDQTTIDGAVTITSGAYSWVGTVVPERGRVEAGLYIAQIVGGKNGLRDVIGPRYYYQATLADIIADIMTDCGETFDAASSDPGLASYQVPRWMRAQGEARVALNAVAAELGGHWRVNRAGQVVMVKDDTWEAVTDSYTEIERHPEKCLVVIAPDEDPFVRPGVTLNGDRIVTAKTMWDAKGMRQVLQVHDGTDKAQDPGQVTAELARRANALATVYGRFYPAKVVAQDADGTLHIVPDSPVMGGLGLTKIPMRHGVPGLTVKVVPGNYVNLFFENGDPKAPAAALWPDGSSVDQVALEAQTSVTIGAPQMSFGALADQSFIRGDDFIDALKTWMTAVGTWIQAVQSVADPAHAATPAYTAAAQTALALIPATLSQTIKGQ